MTGVVNSCCVDKFVLHACLAMHGSPHGRQFSIKKTLSLAIIAMKNRAKFITFTQPVSAEHAPGGPPAQP
jgi:hypothetical protein